MKLQTKSNLTALPFILLVIIPPALVYLPVLIHLNNITPNDDWLEFMTHQAAVRLSIERYGQLPVWCPFLGGGFPLIAHPHNPRLSPTILTTLLLGEVAGLKINAFILYLTGALGMFYLARVIMGYSFWGASFSSLVFSLNPWFLLNFSSGGYSELFCFLFPWFLAFSLRAPRHQGAGAGAVLVSLLVLLEGKFYFLIFHFFTLLFAILNSVRLEEKKLKIHSSDLKSWFTILFVSGMLGMIKIVPMLHLLMLNARPIDNYDLVSSNPFWHPTSLPAFLYRIATLMFIRQQFTSQLYIGGLPFLLFGLSAIVYFKKFRKLLLLLVIFTLLLLPHNNPLNIFKVLWHLPGFHSMVNPPKYFSFFVIFIVTLISGRIFTPIMPDTNKPARNRMPSNKPSSLCRLFSRFRDKRSARGVLILAVIMLATIPLFRKDILVFSATFSLPPTEVKPAPEFFQIKGMGIPRNTNRTFHSNQYYNLLRGVGTIDWYSVITLPESSRPRYFVSETDLMRINPEYRGEAYCLQAGNTVSIEYFSPTKILLKTKLNRKDTVVVNQNFSKFWHSSPGSTVDWEGLIAVFLPRGEHLVTLSYRPLRLYLGAIISGATLVVLIAGQVIPRVGYQDFRCCLRRIWKTTRLFFRPHTFS